MKKRAQTRTRRPAPRKECWALMVVDGATVRKKLKRQYERVVRDLGAAKAEVDHFQTKEQPLYFQWLSREFGPLITSIRERSRELQEKRQLLWEIESEALLTGASYAQAYRRVMRRREAPVTDEESEREEGARRRASQFFEDVFGEELGDEMFQELFGEEENFENRREWPDFEPPGKKPTPVSQRLKELYRALVRLLHPDTRRELSPQRKEWWHLAQEAYRAGDADQLEVILTLCEIETKGTTDHTSASVLMRIIKQFKKSLRLVRKQLSEFRALPAWGFSKRAASDLAEFERETRRALQRDLLAVENELAHLTFQLEAIEERANRVRGKRRAARSASDWP